MASPGCTRHVVKMTSEQNFLQHLTFRAATAAASECSQHFLPRKKGKPTMNLLRTNEFPALEAGVTRSNDTGTEGNPVAGFKRTLNKKTPLSNGVSRTSRNWPWTIGTPPSLGDGGLQRTEGAVAPKTQNLNYGNVDFELTS